MQEPPVPAKPLSSTPVYSTTFLFSFSLDFDPISFDPPSQRRQAVSLLDLDPSSHQISDRTPQTTQTQCVVFPPSLYVTYTNFPTLRGCITKCFLQIEDMSRPRTDCDSYSLVIPTPIRLRPNSTSRFSTCNMLVPDDDPNIFLFFFYFSVLFSWLDLYRQCDIVIKSRDADINSVAKMLPVSPCARAAVCPSARASAWPAKSLTRADASRLLLFPASWASRMSATRLPALPLRMFSPLWVI